MSSLYGLAGKLFGELCSPVFQDYIGKPWGFGSQDEFDRLKNTVSAIEAVLLDAEEKERTNHQIRDWLIKIKLVFYDLEDLLQEVTTEALKRQVMTKNKKAKKVHIFFSSSNQIMYRLKMGRKVKLITERLDAIASDRAAFNLTERREEMHVIGSRRREESHSFVPLEKFVGREEDKSYVVKHLLESDTLNNVSVISIVGIGGLGKTALAQYVYNLEEVKRNFDLMMWVCVSDVFDVKLICEKVIESATKTKCERLQMDTLKDELRDVIDGKKYLLVLDDVWNESPMEWEKLEDLLACGAKGSKILLTSRAELVARASKSITTHVLKGFSHEESWSLFKKVAFERVMGPPSSTIVAIGKEVIEVCAGVPLAIKTIGSLLGLKEKEIDWFDFKRNDLPLITRDSKGTIVQILKLSYDYLSPSLKRCFTYCAIYPKDYIIEKDRLIMMWIAHGIVKLDGTTRSLEDVGEQNFMDLFDRSLFEVEEKSFHGTVYSCKMHDLLHDLALSVGGNEYWSTSLDVNCIDKITRHALANEFIPVNLLRAESLRTLVFEPYHGEFYPEEDTASLEDFKKIRVLDLQDIYVEELPDFFYVFKFLKYLDLSSNKFEFLPESIGRLYNLQTLKLDFCKNLKELPKGLRNLVCLRHLDVSDCYKLTHMPRGLGELTSLRRLSDFVVGPEGTNCSELGELKSLVNLSGRFNIRNLRGSRGEKCRSSGGNCYPMLLTEMKFVKDLRLEWMSIEDEVLTEEEEADDLLLFESLKPHPNLKKLSISYFGGKRFPNWMDRPNIGVSLPHVDLIHVCSCKGLRHLPPLGLLPSLRILFLQYNDVAQYTYDKEDEEWNDINDKPYFPLLEKLQILKSPMLAADGRQFVNRGSLHEVSFSGVDTLPGWLRHLPHLQTLKLSFCDNLVTLPEWMGSLTSLQRIEVCACPELFRRSEEETGEHWHKIVHVSIISD